MRRTTIEQPGERARSEPPAAATAAGEPRICVGVITGARGLKGEVWIRTFTADPAAVASYGPVADETGRRRLPLTVIERSRDRVSARIPGIEDRTAAEALKGTHLFVARRALPPAGDDEFYHADLLGLAASIAGEENGAAKATRVIAVHEFGGGTVLELSLAQGGSVMVPFTRAAVPEIDLAAGRLVVRALPGLLGEGADGDERQTAGGPEDADGGGDGEGRGR